MKIKIYYKHTDLGGIVYHSNYIDFCEMARSELFFKEGKSPMIGECHFAVKNIKCDFWGITDSSEINYHLQSYFLVFKKNVIQSNTFKIFWDGVKILNDNGI